MIAWIVAESALAVAAVGLAVVLAPRPMSLAPAVAALAWVMLVQVVTLIAGLVGWLDAAGLIGVSGAVAIFVGLLIAFGWRGAGIEWIAWRTRAKRTIGVVGLRWCAGVAAALAALTLAAIAVGWLVGPHLGDELSYHLTPATEWVARGRIVSLDWPDPRSHWPRGNALVTAWAMALTGSMRGAALAQIHWIALLLAGAWAIARQMGATHRAALAAVAALATVPIVWVQATSALNDLAIAALVIAAAAFIAGRRVTGRDVAWCAIALGVALGVKPSVLLVGPAIGAVGVVRWVIQRRRGRPRPSAAPPDAATGPAWAAAGRPTGSTVALAGMLLVAVVLGGMWFAETAIVRADHNPLYPASLRLGTRVALEGHPRVDRLVGRFGGSNVAANADVMLRDRIWDRHGLPNAQTVNASGFGAVAAGLGLAALAALAMTDRRARPAAIAIVLAMLTLAAGTAADVYVGRFYMPLAVMATVCAVLITPRLATGTARAVWCVMLAIAAVWSVGVTLTHLAPSEAWAHWRSHGLGVVPMSATMPPDHAHLPEAAALLPDDAGPVRVFVDDMTAPVAALHATRLGRPFVYEPGRPTDAAPRSTPWVVLAMPPDVAATYDAVLRSHGYEPMGKGVYRATD